MAHHYAAFMLRHLHHTRDDRRITIEHARTGETCTVTGLDAAIVWLSVRSFASPAASPVNADPVTAELDCATSVPDDGATGIGRREIVVATSAR